MGDISKLSKQLSKCIGLLLYNSQVHESYRAITIMTIFSLLKLLTHRSRALLQPQRLADHHQQVLSGETAFSQWFGHDRESRVPVFPSPS